MSNLSRTLRPSVLEALAVYGKERFPDHPPIENIELSVEGPDLIVELPGTDGQPQRTVRGRLSAPLLLAAEVWGFHSGRLHGSRAMLEPPIGQNGDVEELTDREARRALSRAGLAWIEAGERQEGLFCLRRGLDVSALSMTGTESEQRLLEQIEDEINPSSELDQATSASTTPNALAKKAAPFADHEDPYERWCCAQKLHSALWHLSSSNRLIFNQHAGPALLKLAQDPVPAVREEGLRGLDYLTWKLWCHGAYPEILPHLAVLMEAEFHTDIQAWRLWEACLAEGDEAAAEAAWSTLSKVAEADQTVRLAANFFEHGDWTDARIVGLGRVARALLAKAQGGDPCADRLRRKKKLKPPKGEVRDAYLRRARHHLVEALESARSRTEEDLRTMEAASSDTERDELRGRRGFTADLHEVAALLDLEQNRPMDALRRLVEADRLDQALGLTWRRGRFDAQMRELAEGLSAEELEGLQLPQRITEPTSVDAVTAVTVSKTTTGSAAEALANMMSKLNAGPTSQAGEPEAVGPDAVGSDAATSATVEAARELVTATLRHLREVTCDDMGTEAEWPWPADLSISYHPEEDRLQARLGDHVHVGSPATVRRLALWVWDVVLGRDVTLSLDWQVQWPSPWQLDDQDMAGAWQELGRLLLREGHRESALRCLRLGFRGFAGAPKDPSDEQLEGLPSNMMEAVRHRGPAEQDFEQWLAAGTRNRNQRLKFLVSLADSDEPENRRWIAEALHSQLDSYAPTQVLQRWKITGETLARLAADADETVAEAGLFARQELANQLFSAGAYHEAEPMLHDLLAAEIRVHVNRYHLWTSLLALGRLSEAEQEHPHIFPARFDATAEVYGRCDAAEALQKRAEDRDPCEARRRPIPLESVSEPEEILRLALQILEPCAALKASDDERERAEELVAEITEELPA